VGRRLVGGVSSFSEDECLDRARSSEVQGIPNALGVSIRWLKS
jgi:hypothetical protein